MSENAEKGSDSVMAKIAEIIQSHDSSSSSSDSDHEEELKQSNSVHDASAQPTIFRLFGRERPVYDVLGGGKPADVLLWRDKKSACIVLGTATIVWILFEIAECHLLTLVCHILILSLALAFLWSNAHTFINKSHQRIPEFYLQEEHLLIIASQVTRNINRGLTLLREIAAGKELKKFLMVVIGLWIVSIVGNWCNLLTLIYILFVLMHTLPVFYEKYDHKVDPLAEKATIQIKKQYGVFDEKVLSKIPLPVFKVKSG